MTVICQSLFYDVTDMLPPAAQTLASEKVY